MERFNQLTSSANLKRSSCPSSTVLKSMDLMCCCFEFAMCSSVSYSTTSSPLARSTCSVVPTVHSRVKSRTLAYSAHEPDMQTPGVLSHSSLSKTDPRSRLDAAHWAIEPVHFTRVSRILKSLLKSHKDLRLRTKLLLWLGLFTASPTSATPLVFLHSAQAQVQRQIEEDARNAVLTIQAVQHQREMMLTRKADLLATLAFIRNGDAKTIQDASEDPWQSGDCDLFALADRKGKIIALHTTSLRLSLANAQELLRRSLREDSGTG